MIRKISTGILFLFFSNFVQSQILTLSPGSDLTIKQGTPFFADNIILTPSADFTFSNVSVSRNSSLSQPASNTNIARVYKFSGTTGAFSGSIQINYQDGAELNGLSENNLQLNINNGSAWNYYTSTSNDAVNNYVFTASLAGVTLNEITLAAIGFALPLQWRSFIAARQQKNVQLQWSTFSEKNSKFFIVQNSSNGITWTSLGTVPATGNNSSVSTYNYLHNTPAAGYNYYRIIETDIYGKENYSVVQKIFFDYSSLHVELLGNPVTNGILRVKVELAKQTDALPMLAFYTSDGRLLKKIQSVAGINNIRVNSFAKGTYLLQANDIGIKFLIR